jgi:ABC-type thiamine transport system substrate-binding protein
LLALPAIITRSAQAARSITFAGYGNWFQTAFDRSILEPFRKAHRDITVFYYPVGDSFQGLTMLRDQRARPSTDIVLLETGMAARAHTEGLLDPLDPGALPVMKDLIPQATRPGLAGPALMLNSLVKGSPQAEAAKTLIAWLLAPEAQRLLAQSMAYAPVNTKADLPPSVLARAGATPAMAARRMEMDWVSIAAMSDQITAVWRQRLQADQ